MSTLWSAAVTGAARLSTARPIYVLAALALYVVSLFITGARWRGFLRALGSNVTIVEASLATLGGIAAGNITPSRVGTDPCRISLVRLTTTVTWPQVTLAAAWDRLSEVPSVAILAVMSAIALHRIDASWTRTAAWIAGGVAIVGLAIGIHRIRSTSSPRGWIARLKLDQMTPSVFAAGVGYSALLWLQDVVRLACDGLAVGVHLTATQTATLAMSTIVGGLVPTVGGLVVVEGGLIAGLVAFGVDLPSAVALTAVERAISYGFSTVSGGLVVLLMAGRSLRAMATRGSESLGN